MAAGASEPGRLRFDPVTRRRVRRAGARARPLLLPVAVVAAAVAVLGARPGDTVPPGAPPAAELPDGRVLVVVEPGEPAVVAVAAPGSTVDVYAPAGLGALDALGAGPLAPADLVVSGALVVPPAAAGSAGSAEGASGVVDPVGSTLGAADVGAGAPAALTLVVTDAEAAALAARPGGSFLVAVHGAPGAAPEDVPP